MATRRQLLAALGALPLAGCMAGAGPGTDTGTPSASPSDDPEPPRAIDSAWPMPAADSGRSNRAAGAAGPTARVAEVWRTTMGASLSGPVLAGETLYVGDSDGIVRAVDALTGTKRWQQPAGADAGTPWITGDTVVVPSTDSIHAFATADGTRQWDVETDAISGFLVAPHGVYAAVGRPDPTLISYSPETGREQWRTDFEDPWTTPLFAGDEHVFVSSGAYDWNPWIFAAGSGEFVGDRRPTRGADFAAEQFLHDGVVYAADGFFGNVRAERLTETGYELEWSTGIEAYSGFGLAGGGERIYFQAEAGDEPGLYALSTADGSEAWVNRAVTAGVGRPVVADDAVLLLTDQALRCFDPADGSERWRYPGEGVGEQFIVVDDLVYTTAGETLRALRPP